MKTKKGEKSSNKETASVRRSRRLNQQHNDAKTIPSNEQSQQGEAVQSIEVRPPMTACVTTRGPSSKRTRSVYDATLMQEAALSVGQTDPPRRQACTSVKPIETKPRKRAKQAPQPPILGVNISTHQGLQEVGKGVEFCMRKREQHTRPSPDYLDIQENFDKEMRATLLDFMFEVGAELQLSRETLHTALNYLDRFFTKVRHVPRKQLQLVGVTALHIAAKNKEVLRVPVSKLVYSTDSTYTKEEIFEMEIVMMNELDWVMDPITSYAWVDFYMHKITLSLPTALHSTAITSGFHSEDQGSDDENCSTSTSEGSPEHNMSNCGFPLCDSVKTFHMHHHSTSSEVQEITSGMQGLCTSSSSSSTSTRLSSVSCPVRSRRWNEWIVKANFEFAVFARIMEVLDTALLDIFSLHFLPSALAAAVVYKVLTDDGLASPALVEEVTRYSRNELMDCLHWMEFAFQLPCNPKFTHPAFSAFLREHKPEYYVLQQHNKESLRIFKVLSPQITFCVAAESDAESLAYDEEDIQVHVDDQGGAPTGLDLEANESL